MSFVLTATDNSEIILSGYDNEPSVEMFVAHGRGVC